MNEQNTTVSGTVTHVFAHRFVIETNKGPMLADLTPHGNEKITLHIGDQVTVKGKAKPSELKVSRLPHGGKSVEIPPKREKDHHPFVEPDVAREAARQAGYVAIGEPRRKPKHFELLGRRDGQPFELHIELNGTIRKVKPVITRNERAEGSM